MDPSANTPTTSASEQAQPRNTQAQPQPRNAPSVWQYTTNEAPFNSSGQRLQPVRQPFGPDPCSVGFAPRSSASTSATFSIAAAPLPPQLSRGYHPADLLGLRSSGDAFVRASANQVLGASVTSRTPLASVVEHSAAGPASVSALLGTIDIAGPRSNSSSSSAEEKYRPMKMVAPVETVVDANLRLMNGFSPGYQGNPELDRNRSAPIPAHENCSLFVTGLAPTLTTAQLLGAIRDAGRVYATHINGPDPRLGHMTCAAKVVFFERAGAERFYNHHHLTGFVVPEHPGYRGRVVWNRIRSAEVDTDGRKSRVLMISGPPSLVNEAALHEYLSGKIQYQTESVHTVAITSSDNTGKFTNKAPRALVEFRFGSYRCQAEAARMALTREFKEYGVFCEFGLDPCDVVQNPPWQSASSAWRSTGHTFPLSFQH